MDIVSLVIIVILGVIAWAVNDRVPYEPKWVGQVVILLVGFLWLAQHFGFSLR